MRLALVVTELPRRQDVSGTPIDTEWVVTAATDHDIHVFADQETTGLEPLREAGVVTTVSPQRPTALPGVGSVGADAHQAASMASLHEESPFDAIVYQGDAGTDYAWFAPPLESVPRGVALGTGPLSDHRFILGDAAAFAENGRHVWAATGQLATADFVVSDAPLEAFGLRGSSLPRRSTRAPVGPIERVEDAPELVVVVALFEGPAGLATLVSRMREVVPIEPATTIAVVHRDLGREGDAARDLIIATAHGDVERRLILVATGPDGAAARMLGAADVIVAESLADAVVPAVADRAREVPLIVLDGASAEPAPPLLATEAVRRPPARRALVSYTDATALARSLEVLETDDVDMVIVHDADGSRAAGRLYDLPTPTGADLVVVGSMLPIFGAADPTRIDPTVIGLSRGVWPTVRTRLFEEPSLWDLMTRMLSPSGVEHATYLAVPDRGFACKPLPPSEDADLPNWIPATGMLGRPNLLGVAPPPTTSGSADSSMRDWVKSHRWGDRVRLALPWKFGLLRRAMRDRW